MEYTPVNLQKFRKTTISRLPQILADTPFEMHILEIDVASSEMLFSIGDDNKLFFRVAIPKTSSWNIIKKDGKYVVQVEHYMGKGQNSETKYGKLKLLAIVPKAEVENEETTDADSEEEINFVSEADLSVLLDEAIHSLNKGQREAYDMITAQESNFFFITGSPGVGKSFLAKAIKLFFQKEKKLITAIAPSHKAKKVLSEAMDMQTTTVARFCGYTMEKTDDPAVNDEGEFIKIREAEPTWLAIVDECSMVSEDNFNEIREASKLVIALGDKNQLTAINEVQANMSDAITFELTEQMRQENTDTALYKNIQLVKNRLNGNPDRIRKFEFDESFEISNNLVETYMEGKIDVILSYRNIFIDAYNNEIQKRKTGDTKIIQDDMIILNKPVNAMEGVHIGNRMVFQIIKNNGDIIQVVKIHSTQPDVGTIVDVDIGSENDKTRLLLSREQWATKNFIWDLWLNSWKPVMQWKQFKRFAINASLPYAISVHKSQGSTYDNVGVNLSDIAGAWKQEDMHRMQYVAMSRAKYKCYVKVG